MLTPSAHARIASELHSRAVCLLDRYVRTGQPHSRRDFLQIMVLRDHIQSDAMRAHVAPFPAERIATAAASPRYVYAPTFGNDAAYWTHHAAAVIAMRDARPCTLFFADGTHTTYNQTPYTFCGAELVAFARMA